MALTVYDAPRSDLSNGLMWTEVPPATVYVKRRYIEEVQKLLDLWRCGNVTPSMFPAVYATLEAFDMPEVALELELNVLQHRAVRLVAC